MSRLIITTLLLLNYGILTQAGDCGDGDGTAAYVAAATCECGTSSAGADGAVICKKGQGCKQGQKGQTAGHGECTNPTCHASNQEPLACACGAGGNANVCTRGEVCAVATGKCTLAACVGDAKLQPFECKCGTDKVQSPVCNEGQICAVASTKGTCSDHACDAKLGAARAVANSGKTASPAFGCKCGTDTCNAGEACKEASDKGKECTDPVCLAAPNAKNQPYGCTCGAGAGAVTCAVGQDCDAAKKKCSGAAGAGASGDPHVTNMRGEQFDVLQDGVHELATIPRFSQEKTALLKVKATVARLNTRWCESTFIERVIASGRWLGDTASLEFTTGKLRQPKPLTFKVGEGSWSHWDMKDTLTIAHAKQDSPNVDLKKSKVEGRPTLTATFGKVSLQVSQVMHPHLGFLNVNLLGLTQLDMEVGGILGLDSHGEAATAPVHCKHKEMSKPTLGLETGSDLGSVIRAS